MLKAVGAGSLDELAEQTVPAAIRFKGTLALPPARGESEVVADLQKVADKNAVFKSYIGQGYYGTIVPPVIQRNVLENPGWYTQYTPYQPEIAQGRLEALLNFQTMVADLTALPLSNASLLDEATAAAEAMHMCWALARKKKSGFFVAKDCHPQTIDVVRTRAEPLGIRVIVGAPSAADAVKDDLFGALLQYPGTHGEIFDPSDFCKTMHAAGARVAVCADILALTLLSPPGDFGADIAVGSTQRFGVPMGFGGPHAAYLATTADFRRHLPGRLVGVSRDRSDRVAYRLSLQTREQHIRRDRATSNICTAQALLAIMAGLYAVYHGPEGLTRIGRRVRALTRLLRGALRAQGFSVTEGAVFDTIRVTLSGPDRDKVLALARAERLNLRVLPDGVGVSLDETTTYNDLERVVAAFGKGDAATVLAQSEKGLDDEYPAALRRTSPFLTHEVFQRYRSEHELLRYMHRLQTKDLSLPTSMIALGSCTMKLNATSEMLPVSWAAFSSLHPFAPAAQTAGYRELFTDLESWLSEITGFAGTSLQPNAGAQGEYAGLLVIRAYHKSRGDEDRNVCLIPMSAHGTNPASAVMAGFRVVPVLCDLAGNIDVHDLKAKAQEHKAHLGAIMVTYPSTHGVFEKGIKEICSVVHSNGGQVYLDGANMNAQIGLCRPGDYGADVCHLNLHKTFCIPHGGGGPGMGPICVASHLVPYLPAHVEDVRGDDAIRAVSAAPYGSPSILPISWVYIAAMGGEGLKRATQVAILNANYMAKRLEGEFSVLYRGENARVAHEFILDMRPFKKSAGVEVDDIAKRLMDYGFHAPTMSFPVPGTLMIEPTESESRDELDRFCDALLAIRGEIRDIEEGRSDRALNPLKGAPHTAEDLCGEWARPYTREHAAYPASWLREHKFWPPVGRIDQAYGDRNLICTCPSVAELAS